MRKTASLLALCAALSACGNSIKPYSTEAFAKYPCIMASDSGSADASKPWNDPTWFGTDSGISGVEAMVPYLHVHHPDAGCALRSSPISHEVMEDAVVD